MALVKLAFDPDEAVAALSARGSASGSGHQEGGAVHASARDSAEPVSGAAAGDCLSAAHRQGGGDDFGPRDRVARRRQRGLKPEILIGLSDDKLRAAGLSRAKVLAVKDLAAKTLDGTVPTLARLKKMDDAEIVSRLVEVRGVGPWTVEMLLIFKLGRPDVLPTSDYGVRMGFMLDVRDEGAAQGQGNDRARRALAAVSLGRQLVYVARRGHGPSGEKGDAARLIASTCTVTVLSVRGR